MCYDRLSRRLREAAGDRDVFLRMKCEGQHATSYIVTVPPHATKLVKMRPVDCPKCD